MAITFQSFLDQQSGTTVAFNSGAGANPFLLVNIMRRAGSTISITYAGVSMSQLGSGLASVWNAGDTSYQFILAGPTTGSNNIVITHNGTLVRWTCAAYNGVNQATPTSNNTTHQSASAAALAVSVTPSQSSWIIGSGWVNNGGGANTADGNTTMRTTASGNQSIIFDSNSNQASAYAVGYSTAQAGDLLGFALIPVASGVASSISLSALSLLGVGN